MALARLVNLILNAGRTLRGLGAVFPGISAPSAQEMALAADMPVSLKNAKAGEKHGRSARP
jgi:hypothetical protein